MATQVQESKLAIIKGKMPPRWSMMLAEEFNCTRQNISWLFRTEKYNHPAWDRINAWAQEYDDRMKAAEKLSETPLTA